MDKLPLNNEEMQPNTQDPQVQMPIETDADPLALRVLEEMDAVNKHVLKVVHTLAQLTGTSEFNSARDILMHEGVWNEFAHQYEDLRLNIKTLGGMVTDATDYDNAAKGFLGRIADALEAQVAHLEGYRTSMAQLMGMQALLTEAVTVGHEADKALEKMGIQADPEQAKE